MHARLTAGLFAAVLGAAAPRTASAQLVVFGSADAGGQGSSLLLAGLTVSPGRIGVQPIVGLQAYHLTYRTGPGAATTSNDVIAPSLGLKSQNANSAVSLSGGYAFVSSSTRVPALAGPYPIPAAPKNGAFATAQGDWWGSGDRSGQAIATYNFANEFLWSRIRGAHTVGMKTSPLMLGGEAGFFGGGTGTKRWGYFLGPIATYKVTPQLKVGGGAGYRANTSSGSYSSGYAKVDFVWVSR